MGVDTYLRLGDASGYCLEVQLIPDYIIQLFSFELVIDKD
jgi:hypothetical protein